MKYDKTYDIVVHMAKVKMLMNEHKGDIEDTNTDVLIELAKGELDELHEAIRSNEEADNYVHVIEEVADVLNFAIAAAHNAIEGYRSRK